MNVPYTHQCSVIPNGPSHVARVLMGMRVTEDDWKHTFFDRLGQSVTVPRNEMNNNREYFDDGYAKALWDFRNGSMLLGEDGRTIYVRDVDESGANRLLDSWHAIGSIEDEYHVKGAGKVYLPWNVQMRVECSKLKGRVRHGVKFANMAFYRIDGHVRRVLPGDPMFTDPFEISLGEDYDEALVAEAGRYLRFVTADEHSAQNLGRMFATPLLEAYKHLFYVLYGGGGNGKGILLGALNKSFPGLSAAVNAKTLLGGAKGAGGFATDQEMLKLIGALWAYDEDADIITLEQATLLKKIGTGDTMAARRIQENTVSFRNKATFIIASNNPVIMANTEALKRRRVFVRMRDNRAEHEFKDLLAFRAKHGAVPFLMASCRLWEQSDKPWDDVAIGSGDDLTEHEQWIVDQIITVGYAVSGDNPYYASSATHRNSVTKLGLESTCKRIDGKVARVLVVADEKVFAVYRAKSEHDISQAVEETVAAPPQPIEGDMTVTPDELGYPVNYATVSDGKKSYDWQKVKDLPAGSTPVPNGGSAYAVIPADGMAVIDLDVAKDRNGNVLQDAPTGWDVFSREIGAYGSDAFPRTYLVSTPTGERHGLTSVHAYYLIPGELKGRLKNGVHLTGAPVDIRCEGKGYVIGAGSVLDDGGTYRLLDMPDGEPPVMPAGMVSWLKAHGYVEGETPTTVKPDGARPVMMRTRYRSTRMAGKSVRNEPDMTPVAPGSRNDTLHRWAYGRLANHPDNASRIRDDLYQRGHASGLKDNELETIWRSVTRQLNGGGHA
ncbi:bifunctional DNA primase/polymerase [Bifidobacterium biavatii]|uniref:Phage primase n=1 Tax=Bifidobacterium biavatii DSM 23969 TaxID=1437608 RepID=A0A086ZTB9_9BIFI|nr:DUF5906 domain-containing protein [Bifidobacterium biavatii]KFI49769.1 phage primase [Bifidobacterium biavatii DSM 23969]